jgi:hypothetical protein
VWGILEPCTGQMVMITVSDPSSCAQTGRRPAPLVRAAIPRAPHPPAYVAKLQRAWRVIVPIRGRLTPRIMARAFPTQLAALRWLASADGEDAVAHERGQHRPSASVQDSL